MKLNPIGVLTPYEDVFRQWIKVNAIPGVEYVKLSEMGDVVGRYFSGIVRAKGWSEMPKEIATYAYAHIKDLDEII